MLPVVSNQNAADCPITERPFCSTVRLRREAFRTARAEQANASKYSLNCRRTARISSAYSSKSATVSSATKIKTRTIGVVGYRLDSIETIDQPLATWRCQLMLLNWVTSSRVQRMVGWQRTATLCIWKVNNRKSKNWNLFQFEFKLRNIRQNSRQNSITESKIHRHSNLNFFFNFILNLS